MAYPYSFTYDKVGNRQTMTKGGATVAYIHDVNNRLKEIRQGSTSGPLLNSFDYDDDGNMITKKNGVGATIQSFGYDARGRVKTITTAGAAQPTQLNYDPFGYRIYKSDSKGQQTYLLEGEHLEGIMSGSNWVAKYLRGAVIDEVVNGYQFDTEGKWTNYTFHHDTLQSVLGLSGHEGSVLQTIQYGPFGEKIATTGASNNNRLNYTGREEDTDNGLYYYRARYYDPAIGRFITEDPKGFGAGINFYAYVHNNPINANDPYGMMDVVYRLGSQNPTIELTNSSSVKQFIDNNSGSRYPLGKLMGVPQGGFSNIISGNNTDLLIMKAANKIDNEHKAILGIFPNYPQISNLSREGKAWDFKWQRDYLDPKSLYLMNGVAQQFDVAGNAMWAAGMQQIGVPQNTAKAAAHAYSLLSGGKLDDPRDQLGIEYGYLPKLAVEINFDISSGFDGFSSAANGGFVIYPNKVNSNMMRSVYSK